MKNNAVVQNRNKTLDDLVIDTCLPLYVWSMQKAMGCFFNREQWSQVANSLVPASNTLRASILSECSKYSEYKDLASERLRSPCWRRKIRRRSQRYIARDLVNNPLREEMTTYFMELRRRIMEAAGHEASGTIRKLRDVEAELWAPFEAFFRGDEEVTRQIKELFPPDRTIGSLREPGLIERMLSEIGGEAAYYSEVVELLANLTLSPRNLNILPSNGKYPLLRGLGWKAEINLPESASLTEFLNLTLDRIKVLFKEEEAIPTLQHLIGKLLVLQHIQFPHSDKKFKTSDSQNEVTELSSLWSQQTELSDEEARESIIDALAQKGITYSDLTAKEWAEVFERHDLIRDGYVFSSKTGISISSFYGEKAHAKEQKWSRIKKKIDDLSSKSH